jgi:hypothetical protein
MGTGKDCREYNSMREIWVTSGAETGHKSKVLCPHDEASSILQRVCHDLLKTSPSPMFMSGGHSVSLASLMITVHMFGFGGEQFCWRWMCWWCSFYHVSVD